MDIIKMIDSIKEHAAGSGLEEMICATYQEETDSYFLDVEADYRAATEALNSITQEQKDILSQIVHGYSKNRTYAIQYCLSSGLFAGFRQCFVETSTGEDDFNQLVEQGLFAMPGMERHTSYIEQQDKNLDLLEKLEAALPESMHEHTVSLACAWDERVHHAGLVSFYLGYRLALDCIGTVSFPTVLEMVRKQLATEYSLGLIGTYDQIMRGQEAKKPNEK